MYSPICVGGVGGSGTRLIANILKKRGLFLGHDLNESTDTLLFTLLFKDPSYTSLSTRGISDRYETLKQYLTQQPFTLSHQDILRNSVTERPLHGIGWLKKRVENAISAPTLPEQQKLWGWKEPNTHIFIDKILPLEPTLKYIHVVRHGLDMAYSSNQNQLKIWGQLLLNRTPEQAPEESFNYWCAVHRRIIELEKQFSGRILILNYDLFVQRDEIELNRFFNFIGINAFLDDPSKSIYELFSPPKSIGRSKFEDTSWVTENGKELLAEFKFSQE